MAEQHHRQGGFREHVGQAFGEAVQYGEENKRLRIALETSQQARQAAEQNAAVLAARLEAMSERATKAEERSEKAEHSAQQASQSAAELRGLESAEIRRRLRAVVDSAPMQANWVSAEYSNQK